tara:strand:+ start:845 stop:1972 length:1128 start_codon:yes stop_codon:yes gene_type:complete
MRLIRNPFNENEVDILLKYIVPICKDVKQYAWYQNDQKRTIIETPKWKDEVNRDALIKRYNRKDPLNTNDSSNLFRISSETFRLEEPFTKIAKVMEDKYKAYPYLRGAFYYPPTGYMGWHTNCNTPGERFYITWASEDKKSFFRYYDYEKDEVVTDYDDQGLTVRQFKVPESAPYFWHCVGSECDRFSFGFMLDTTIMLDWDTHQRIVKKIDGKGGDISKYITHLFEGKKECDYSPAPYSFTGERHSCDIETGDGADWRVRKNNCKVQLSDIKHLLTDDKIKIISFDDVARKGMKLPVIERREHCFCCQGVRYLTCDTKYPPILCNNMPNPFNKKYRCIDGKHRIEKMLSQKITESKCYVLDYFDVEEYFIDYTK